MSLKNIFNSRAVRTVAAVAAGIGIVAGVAASAFVLTRAPAPSAPGTSTTPSSSASASASPTSSAQQTLSTPQIRMSEVAQMTKDANAYAIANELAGPSGLLQLAQFNPATLSGTFALAANPANIIVQAHCKTVPSKTQGTISCVIVPTGPSSK